MAESQIESSNSVSTTVKKMQAGTVDLSYKIKPHLPSGFCLPTVINKSIPNDTLFGNYTYFEVNNANFMSKLDVDISGTAVTATGTSTINSTWHPSQLVDRVEYRNPQGILGTVYGESIKFFYDFAPEAVKNNSYNKFLDPATEAILTNAFPVSAGQAFKFTLELPSPWTIKGAMTESLKMDLSKYTDFSVYIYFKTKPLSNIPTQVSFASVDYVMNLWTYVINQSYVDNLLKMNGAEASSTVYTFDYQRSSITTALNAVSTTLTSRKQNFIGRTFLRLVPEIPAAGASKAELPITSLQIQFNGTNVFQGTSNTLTARELNGYSKDKFGSSALTFIYDPTVTDVNAPLTKYVDNSQFCGVCVHWKMLEDMGIFSGGISTKDLVNVTYVVNHADAGAVNSYRLVVIDEVASMLDYDASSLTVSHFTPS